MELLTLHLPELESSWTVLRGVSCTCVSVWTDTRVLLLTFDIVMFVFMRPCRHATDASLCVCVCVCVCVCRCVIHHEILSSGLGLKRKLHHMIVLMHGRTRDTTRQVDCDIYSFVSPCRGVFGVITGRHQRPSAPAWQWPLPSVPKP